MRRLRWLGLAIALLAATVLVRPYLRGLSFVIRAADVQGTARRLANLVASPGQEREIMIPTTRGTTRARLYLPLGSHRRAALLTSGLHPSGIDEPRLIRLARELSAAGVAIVTPDIPELSRLELAPSVTDTIEQAAVWLASQSDLAPDHRVGLMGISFSGGLSVVAAGRSSLAGKLAYVFALGGHDDLPRVLRYVVTGTEPYPSGRRIHLTPGAGASNPANASAQPDDADAPFVRAPHALGGAVMLLTMAERLVPPAQIEPLREATRQYLLASMLDARVDKAAADEESGKLRQLTRTMPEPSATLLRYVSEGDLAHLGARLLPFASAYGGAPALSPSKSPKPTVPVYLLHDSTDNVIPSLESEYLADELRGRAPVHLLVSGAMSRADDHGELPVSGVLQLASFWGDLLSQ